MKVNILCENCKKEFETKTYIRVLKDFWADDEMGRVDEPVDKLCPECRDSSDSVL